MRRRVLENKSKSDSIIDTNGYDFVDMGEAGIWATCNLGAETPLDAGLYFQWGDTEGWTEEQIENKEKLFGKSDYKFSESYKNSAGETLYRSTKYNSTDKLTTLEPEDDIVHLTMKGSWRMPTQEEVDKLIELCNYTKNIVDETTKVKYNKLTLKTDESKFIIWVNSGQVDNNKVTYKGTYGYFWTSTVDNNNNNRAMKIRNFSSSYADITYEFKYYGLPVRGFIPPNSDL